MPLYLCDGLQVETVESIAPSSSALHPLQSEMKRLGASQCGYCTAGVLMCMRAAADTAGDIEDSLDGSFCRCTGYRSIVASAHNVERTPRIERKRLPSMQFTPIEWIDRPSGTRRFLYRPQSLKQLLTNYRAVSEDGRTVALVGGASGGVLRSRYDLSRAAVLISTARVVEMRVKTVAPDGSIELGAAVTVSEAIQCLVECKLQPIEQLRALWKRVGNSNTRNVATIGGNLAMRRQDDGFASDVFSSLAALDASVEVVGL